MRQGSLPVGRPVASSVICWSRPAQHPHGAKHVLTRRRRSFPIGVPAEEVPSVTLYVPLGIFTRRYNTPQMTRTVSDRRHLVHGRCAQLGGQ